MKPSFPKILIVEDEKEISDCIKEFLESENYQVGAAENGREALDVLSRSSLPNLILLDMKMPQMNGWQFAEEFKILYGHSVPLLVMTAASQVELRAKEVKADDFIGKPFDFNQLHKKIRKLLENSKNLKETLEESQKPTEVSKSA